MILLVPPLHGNEINQFWLKRVTGCCASKESSDHIHTKFFSNFRSFLGRDVNKKVWKFIKVIIIDLSFLEGNNKIEQDCAYQDKALNVPTAF